MTPEREQEIYERAEDALAATWGGDSPIPVGPSISDSFQNHVRSEKALAEDALSLLAELSSLRGRVEQAEKMLVETAQMLSDASAIDPFCAGASDVLEWFRRRDSLVNEVFSAVKRPDQ